MLLAYVDAVSGIMAFKAPSILATMSKQHCRMLQVERCFRNVECCFDVVAVFGNNEATFDIVERTKFYNRIVCGNVASTKSNVASTMLLRHCCWCGQVLRVD